MSSRKLVVKTPRSHSLFKPDVHISIPAWLILAIICVWMVIKH
jgi:hypothetical protein